MPIAWLPPLPQLSQKVVTVPYQGSELTMRGPVYEADLKNSVVFLRGGVNATYGPETLTAGSIEVHLLPTEQFLLATGNVVLTDPDANVSATTLRLSWAAGNQTAYAENVVAVIAGATIKAQSADITRDKWTFRNYYVTTDRASHPLYSVSGAELVISPGQSAQLKSSQLNILGQRVYGFRTYSVNLDPRSSGWRPPTPEYRGGHGIGYNWSSGALVAPNTAVELHSDAFPGSLPGYGAQVTESFVPVSQNRLPITPRSEFSQRWEFGYLENVLVTKPRDELNYLQQPRNALSAQSTFNAGVSGRGRDNEFFSVPASLSYERGGRASSGAYLSEVRVETIDSYRQPYVTRGEWFNSFELPPVKLGEGLYNMARIDSGLYQSNRAFGWLRGTESLVYKPSSALTFGAGVFVGTQWGSPDFDIDPLDYKNGVVLRADYVLGPRRLSYLTRYDTHLGWFDHEYVFTQAVGPLQAFLIYRRYPGDSHFGVTLRIDQLQDLLTRRAWRRSDRIASAQLP